MEDEKNYLKCEKIEKCPFCSHEGNHLLRTNMAFGDELPTTMYHVACEKCGAFGSLGEFPDQAINIWNVTSRQVEYAWRAFFKDAETVPNKP